MEKRLSAVAAREYRLEELMDAVERHCAAFGILGELAPGMRVVLKPNLLMKRTPDRATTTHPLVVEAVVRVLQGHGVRNITLADSPGGPYAASYLNAIYKATGMADVAKRTGITLNRDTTWRELRFEAGVQSRSFEIITPIADADYIINLPKLKTHTQMMLSAGCKNLFGCIPGLHKPEFHYRFPDKADFGRMLVDLSLLLNPQFTLLDAVESMEGDGPSAGTLRKTGMTFAARSPHALDLGMARWIGAGIEEIYSLRHAADAGLCPEDPDELDWVGEKPEPLHAWKLPASAPLAFSNAAPGFLRRSARWFERRFLPPRPAVSKRRCIGCGKCAESCVPGAIHMADRRANIDRAACIRCFCCQELCPVGAIAIRRFRLLRL